MGDTNIIPQDTDKRGLGGDRNENGISDCNLNSNSNDRDRDWLRSQFEEFKEEIRREVREEVKREVHLQLNIKKSSNTGQQNSQPRSSLRNKTSTSRVTFGSDVGGHVGGHLMGGGGRAKEGRAGGDIEHQAFSDTTGTSNSTGSKSIMAGILTQSGSPLACSSSAYPSSFDIHDLREDICALQRQIHDISKAGGAEGIPRIISRRGISLRTTFLKMSKSRNDVISGVRDQYSTAENGNATSLGPGRGPSPLQSTEITTLEDDTFSLMMISKPFSQAWVLGLVVFVLQALLGLQIVGEQVSAGPPFLDIPFKVDIVVRSGQFLTIILCLTAQSDVLTSIQAFLVLGKDSNWDVVIGEEGNRSRSLWMTRIVFPVTLKLVQGIIVVLVCFVIILQSDDIIDLLKDFTALMVLSDTDNIFFDLAAYGYLGHHLQMMTIKVGDAEIDRVRNCDDDAVMMMPVPTFDTPRSASFMRGSLNSCEDGTGETSFLRRKRGFNIRFSFLFLILGALIASWVAVVIKQEDGTFFKKRYPNCTEPTVVEAFQLARDHFGNGTCFGGTLNTLECGFEGGDCINFNLAYPLCKGDDLTNVEERIGDDNCDLDLGIAECDYDGYDCCSFEIVNHASFGDGRCNGGEMAKKGCAYDGGDCDSFRKEFPTCDLDILSQEEGSINVTLGDGICQGGIYHIESCGYEYGDCDKGQIGQDITVGDVYAANSIHNQYTEDSFFFNVKLSLDGSKLFFGKFFTDGVDDSLRGIVVAYTFNAKKRTWMGMGSEISGVGEEEIFGYSIAMNYNGSRVAVGAPAFDDGENSTWYSNNGYVEAFDFNEEKKMWVPLGKKIVGLRSTFLGFSIDMSADGSRLAIAAPSLFGRIGYGEVSIWDLQEQRHWVQVGQKIRGKNNMENIGSKFLYMSSSDGSSVIFSTNNRNDASVMTRVYRYDDANKQGWSQMGDDIPSPYPGVGKTSQISANGNRIAVSSHAGNPDAPGQVQVFDFNAVNNTWDQVGKTIFEPSSKKDEPSPNGNGFGRSLTMSSDGNLLAIASIGLDCVESSELCATGSVHLFGYDEARHTFNVIPSTSSPLVTTGTIQARQRSRKSSIFGLQVSFNSEGSLISISGYDIGTKKGFVNVYDINELFYPNCTVYDPYLISDGQCAIFEPYISEACGFDGGDCPELYPAEGLPDCYVPDPKLLGDERCFSFLPYNTKECNFDGGDCDPPSPVEGYPGCIVSDPERIKNGVCTDYLPYNSKECGFDGGDCL